MRRNRFLFLLLFFLVPTLGAQEIKWVAFYTKNIAKVADSDVKVAIANVLDEGSKRSGMTLKEAFPATVDGVIDGFVDNRYQLITLNTYDVLKNYEKIEPYIGKIWTIAKRITLPKEQYVFLVKKGMRLTDLKGKSIAYVSFNEMQRVYLEYIVMRYLHTRADSYYSHVISYASVSKAILKLFFAQVDAAVVSRDAYDMAVELNPQLQERLEILFSSRRIFPSTGLTISRKGEKKIEKLYEEFTQEQADIEKLSRVLMLYKAEAIINFSTSDMNELYSFYHNYELLKERYH